MHPGERLSRCQPFPEPPPAGLTGRGLQGIAQAVMQATFAALPKLPVVGFEPIPAPMRRARRLQQELGTVACCVGDQYPPARYHLALWTGRVTTRESSGRVRNNCLPSSLTFSTKPSTRTTRSSLHPVKLQRRIRVASQFLTLSALIIGEPDNAPCIKPFISMTACWVANCCPQLPASWHWVRALRTRWLH